jgi:hypothetical protein
MLPFAANCLTSDCPSRKRIELPLILSFMKAPHNRDRLFTDMPIGFLGCDRRFALPIDRLDVMNFRSRHHLGKYNRDCHHSGNDPLMVSVSFMRIREDIAANGAKSR